MGWAITLHGGAGDILATLPLERREIREAALRHCLQIGVEALKAQKSSLDVELVVEAASKYSTVDTLVQQVHPVPARYKDCYLVVILTEKPHTKSMVFTRTCEATRLPISVQISQGTRYFFGFVGFEGIEFHAKCNQAGIAMVVIF